VQRTPPNIELVPGLVLSDRYRVNARVERLERCFVGLDLESGEPVLMVELPPASASSVARGALVGHPHLSTLLDMIPTAKGSVGVFEYLPGPTLRDVLAEQGALPEHVAATCCMALVNALTALHRRGAAHGMISPEAVVISEQPGQGPWLSYAAPPPPSSPYRSPERGAGPPSLGDDLWAMGALLHQMLLGYAPPAAGYASMSAFPAAADVESGLRDVLVSCLSTRPEHRVRSAQELGELLASVQQSVAPTKVTIPRATFARPPRSSLLGRVRTRLPASLGRRLAEPPTRRALLGLFGVTLFVGIWAVVRATAKPPRALPSTLAAASASERPAPGSWSGLLPAPSTPEPVALDSLQSGEELGRCVVNQLPPRSLPEPESFDWLCVTRDPREGVRLLAQAFAAAGAARGAGWAMTWWNQLGAYRMAAFSVVRSACCPRADKLELPAPADCGPLAPLLDELGAAVAANRTYDDWLARYQGNLTCQERHGHQTALGLRGPLSDQQQDTFLRFVDARRR
jgi:hypothetical protein